MNISKITSAVLLTVLSMGTLSAYDQPHWIGDFNVANTPVLEPAIGGKVFGADANLTLNLASDWSAGATFDLIINNGTVPTGGTYLVCNGDEQVGRYLTMTTPSDEEDTTKITFELLEGVDDALLREDQNISFVDGKSYNPSLGGQWAADLDCSSSKTMTILPAEDKCATVHTENGLSDSNDISIPEMTSKESMAVAQYREEVMISCTAPICKLNTKRSHFINGLLEEGVNLRGTVVDENMTNHVGFNDDCYFQGCYTPPEDSLIGTSECNTTIVIKNNIRDLNLTSAGFNLVYTGDASTMTIDVNGTAGTLNTTTNVDISTILADGGEGNVTVSLHGADGATILPGALKASLADINGLAVSLPEYYSHAELVSPEQTLVTIEDTTPTHFTVTYMNPNYKTFAMVTAKSQDVRLNALITDSNGKTATAELGVIEAGKTKFVWADTSDHATDPLQTAATAGGLNNAWHVDFKASAGVDVAAYMDVNGGQRTLTVLYPEFTNGLLVQGQPTSAYLGLSQAAVDAGGLITTPIK